MSEQTKIPVTMTIAGSDSGGGAGIQADLKTFSALGVYGTSVITALTAQNTQTVSKIAEVDKDMVSAQMQALFDDFDIRAIKIGMLSSISMAEHVASLLKERSQIPIVLDPVMVSKSGDDLLPVEAINVLKTHLMPLSHIVTPNIPEIAYLLGLPQAKNHYDMVVQGQQLNAICEVPILVKGGHLDADGADNVLIQPGDVRWYRHERVDTKNTHGTGCTLSSALAAQFALGKDMYSAVEAASAYTYKCVQQADRLGVGNGHGPVHHFHAFY